MPRNVEIKARARLPKRLQELASALATRRPEHLDQTDTFFSCTKGRLKLRQFGGGRAELIYYERPDSEGLVTSSYVRTPIDAPDQLHECLRNALGVRAKVRKHRTVYWSGQTRIHLDEVEGLGSFLELEVVLRPDQSVEEGEAEVKHLMGALEIEDEDLINVAYVDLLSRETEAASPGKGDNHSSGS